MARRERDVVYSALQIRVADAPGACTRARVRLHIAEPSSAMPFFHRCLVPLDVAARFTVRQQQ